ncbi:ABC transporter ATP-binding protein [Melissococcus sp. OM08-11BH]|uniref:ABC transporter ATP-binding protein n=1 Tax=Melissococcus sp. OM08-11BH TaxID=2293110 RepID=UPI000E4FF46A|nr:ABC transporter ATP-binding protein [Melissococcus sp. OM08-11BH]RGI29330.1 ABC transporter ATP-binding protein [Melissococcus sp. OM08-11BH]
MFKQTLSTFSPYLKPFKKAIILNACLSFLYGLSSVLVTMYIGKAIDSMTLSSKTGLVTQIFLIIVLTCLAASSFYFLQRISQHIAYTSMKEVRKKGYHKLNKLPINYFDTHSHGDTMNRFSTDLDYISEALLALFNQLFPSITIIIVALGIMLSLNVILTGVILLITAGMFLVNVMIAKKGQRYFNAQQQLLGKMSGYINEQFSHLKTIKSYEYEETVIQQFQDMNLELQQTGQQAQFISSLTNPLSRFIDHMGYLLIGLVSGLLIINISLPLSLGMLSSFIIYSGQFSKPLIELSSITTQLQTAFSSIKRINDLLDEPEEETYVKKLTHPFTPIGNVSFSHVYFSYDPASPLIEDFNLTVKQGQTVAIVGKTGAGKSTLVNLLMNFYPLDKGVITIDSVPITDIPKDELRRSFGMVLQETWLFQGTIWDNLTFGNTQATKQDVIKACEEANIYHFIQQLSHGFDTMIGQSGVLLSEGQKQLFTIARTMISKPPMLILDEATSSIDTLTEQHIQTAFDNMMSGKTSFIIAHRLSTIKKADIILVMDKGKIIETGTHDSLLKNKDGAYSSLYHSQFSH